MPEYTQNYNLIKPGGTEYFDIGHFNQNADTIDAELQDIQIQVHEVATGLEQIKDPAQNSVQSINGKTGSHIVLEPEDVGAKADVPSGTTEGDGGAYSLTVAGEFAFVDGQEVKVNFHTTNTNSATLSVNGTGARALIYPNGEPVKAGDFVADSWGYATASQTLNAYVVTGGGGESGGETFDPSQLEEAIVAVKSTADGAASTASAAQSTANTANTTANAALSRSGGTMTGAIVGANGTNLTSQVLRNIYAGTADMTAGATPLTTGLIYLVYEV